MILNAFLKQIIPIQPNIMLKMRKFSEPNLKKNKKILTENKNLDVTQKDSSGNQLKFDKISIHIYYYDVL